MTFTNGTESTAVAGSNVNIVLTGKETVIVEDRPIPKCGPKDLLVKIMATGICGSDLSYYYKGGIGTYIVKKPLVLGHESCGIVCEVGSEVTGNYKIGDRVAVEPALPCRTCKNCRSGHFNYCSNDTYMASPPTDGTMCQWYACPETNAVLVPSNIPWEVTGSIQPLAISVHIARRAGLRAHQTVAIFGCGPLGMLCMAVAKAYGARKILAVDISEKRLAFAKNYAATHTYLPQRRPANEEPTEWSAGIAAKILEDMGETGGVDLVIEASGAEPCMHLGIAVLRTGGTYLQAGMGAPAANFPVLQIATRELNILGSLRYTAGCFEDAIDLLSRGAVDLKPLVTKTYALKDAEDAFQACKAGTEIKIVIMNQQ